MGETAAIRAVARRVRSEGAQVRELARRVGATDAIAWQSAAATAFRERVAERVVGLRRAADAVDAAAEAVEAHARACESRVSVLGLGG